MTPGQKAEKRETGRDAEAEAAAGKKAEGPAGSAVFFREGQRRNASRMPVARGRSREAMKREDHGFPSLR